MTQLQRPKLCFPISYLPDFPGDIHFLETFAGCWLFPSKCRTKGGCSSLEQFISLFSNLPCHPEPGFSFLTAHSALGQL